MWANVEIMVEFTLGREPLPLCMQYLFSENIYRITEKVFHDKIKWIITIYVARDQFRHRYIHSRTRHPHILVHYTKFLRNLEISSKRTQTPVILKQIMEHYHIRNRNKRVHGNSIAYQSNQSIKIDCI